MPDRMSRMSRTAAPSYPLLASSGTYVVRGFATFRTPWSARIPVTQPTNDLVTDISRCVASDGIVPGYSSATTRPLLSASQPSVSVVAMTSATVDAEPSVRTTGSSPTGDAAASSGCGRPEPRATRAVGTTSRTWCKDHRLYG